LPAWTLNRVACFWLILLQVGSVQLARANPETIGTWMPAYAAALGLNPKGLPFECEFVDEFTAIVDQPATLEKFGLPNVQAGDELVLHSHANGYFTLRHVRSNRSVKIALAWLVRFGIEPDKGLRDGEPPDHIEGRVVEGRVLAGIGFASAGTAKRFVIEYGDGVWKLTLHPGGECHRVPF